MLVLPSDPDKLVGVLDHERGRQEARLKLTDLYYEGEQPLRFLAPALREELGDRITELVINWPRLGTNAYESRLTVTGFKYARPRRPAADAGDEQTEVADEDLDDEIWGGWQANDMDLSSGQIHLESLIHGRSYAIVGGGDSADDPPIITGEHPSQVYAVKDTRLREIRAAVKAWTDEYGERAATLYTPNATRHYRWHNGEWWELREERDEHELGVPPVVDYLHQGRMLRQLGVSVFKDIIPIADAANKMATDMMISGEFHAMPRRWVFGMSEEDFTDELGKALSTWSAIAGRLWATERGPQEVAAGQFPEADLTNFHNTVKLLAQLAGQLFNLPPHYMSFNTDNPASAEGIKSSESRTVNSAERQQRTLGYSHKRTMRLWHRILTGHWDPRLRRLETQWRNAATPTISQAADSAVKLYTANIVPLRQTRRDLGYSGAEIDQMEMEDERAAARDPLAAFARAGGGTLPPDLPDPGEGDPGEE